MESLRLVQFVDQRRQRSRFAASGSPGYQNELKALGDGAERDVRIVPGLE